MGERKVLSKYFPPDFDPSQLPRLKRPKNQRIKVSMMLPMTIRCDTCGNFIYKGTKFNSTKQRVLGETYLGIQVFRFYFKCSKCSAELSIKTDPQNSVYVVESGATRNFEPWRAEDEEADQERNKREAEELGDAMKSLENRTLDSKREMDILSSLDEMKSLKSRHATVAVEEMLAALERTAAEEQLFHKAMPSVGYAENSRGGGGGGGRLDSLVRISAIQKKKEEEHKTNPTSSLQSLCQSYGSDEDE